MLSLAKGLRPLGNFKPFRTDVNILLFNGGVGDHIGGSLIACKYMLTSYPWINYLIWAPDFLVPLAKELLGHAVCVRPYSLMEKKYNRELITRSTQWDGYTSPMKMHLTTYAFFKLCDEEVEIEHKNSLKLHLFDHSKLSFNLPDRYVVFVVGYTAKVREFSPKVVNTVAKYALDQGYTPVFLGRTITESGIGFKIQSTAAVGVDFSLGVNLIDKTSLIEAGHIISRAKGIVGVDCGLLHLAGCTETPIVAGYTTVAPKHRMPIRHNELGWNVYPVTPDLHCRFCQSNTNFLYGHDYTKCIYNDFECVKELKAEKWIEQLQKIL